MKPQNKLASLVPFLVILMGILAVSTSSIFIRFAQKEASSLVIAGYRLTIASILLSPIALTKYKTELKKLSKKDLFWGIISGTLLAIHFASWITSLEYTTVASSVVLVSTSPLWVAFLAPITIKEPVSKIVFIGMATALVGTLFIAINDICTFSGGINCPPLSQFIQGDAFIGDALAVIGALAGSGYLLIGRNLRIKLPVIVYIFVVYSFSALVLIGMIILSGEVVTGFSPQTYLWFILLAIVPQLIGHSSFNWALGHLSAAYVSITLLGDPISSTILAFIIFNEVPTQIKMFGAILILGGILIASVSSNSEKNTSTDGN